MSRRIIVSAGNTKPEIRQRGYVYQKHRKKSDLWDRTKRAYGFYRIDVPGEATQGQIRVALGFCRDRKSAELKLHREMEKAGVLDPEKIRERITPPITFRDQAEWMLAEIEAGRIVNKKTREPIGERTTDYYSKAIDYLNGRRPAACRARQSRSPKPSNSHEGRDQAGRVEAIRYCR
jgi:hypothetical protein